MRLVRPSWLGHRDENRTFEVYSLDASADGTRLVTGGLDSKVKVWSTDGIAHPDDATKPRLLASMAAHTGAVTAVAFSPDGRFIASGSDDRIVLVSELDATRQPRRREFGSSSSGGADELVESEVWTPRKRLVGHDNDVQDLAWSPDGQLLVSVGLDSAIIVWSGTTFEKLKRLDWHQSHVKGVAFDPANKFFVTCSDDRTARIVRYSRASPTELNFSVEAVISAPFVDSPLTSYFRRCSWSPDGESIACPNATNGPIPTVAILDRGQWAAPKQRQISLIGHEGTTEAAKFSPRLYNESTCVVATAGEDGAVAVWSTDNPRPLVVVQNVAIKLITDIAWARSGLRLYASSLDGSVVLIEFGPTELGAVVPLDKTLQRLEKYSNATDLMDIPQSTEQVDVEKRAVRTNNNNTNNATNTPTTNANTTTNSVTKSVTKPVISSETNSATSSATSATGSATNTVKEQTNNAQQSSKQQDKETNETNVRNETNSTIQDEAAKTDTQSGEPTLDNTGMPGFARPAGAGAGAASSSSSSSSAVQPKTGDRAEETTIPRRQKTSVTKDGRKRVTPMLLNSSGPAGPAPASASLASSAPLALANARLGGSSGGQQTANYAVAYDRPSNALPPGGISTLVIGNKRRADDDPAPPKRVKEEAVYLRPVALNPSTTVSAVRLATPRVVSHLSSDPAASAVLEARNATRAGEPTRITLVARGVPVFVDYIAEYASLIAGAVDEFWAVASDTGVIYVYTPQGMRALPPLVLGAPIALLESTAQYLCAVTATGMAHAWDMRSRRALFAPQSVGPCLDLGMKYQENGLVKAPQVTQCWITGQGHFMIALSSGSVFHFDTMLHCWQRVSESFWAYGSQFWDSTGLKLGASGATSTADSPVTLAELRTNEEALLKAGARGRQLQRQAVNRTVQAGFQGFEEAVSLAHLGTRVAAARSLESPEMLKFTHQLVRKLAERGDRLRLGEVFRSLPADLLSSALDVAAQYKGVQTLVAEYHHAD